MTVGYVVIWRYRVATAFYTVDGWSTDARDAKVFSTFRVASKRAATLVRGAYVARAWT